MNCTFRLVQCGYEYFYVCDFREVPNLGLEVYSTSRTSQTTDGGRGGRSNSEYNVDGIVNKSMNITRYMGDDVTGSEEGGLYDRGGRGTD